MGGRLHFIAPLPKLGPENATKFGNSPNVRHWISAIITWYAFDYLTPSNIMLGINADSDWRPYEHGLTPTRYLSAFAAQAAATLFTIAYAKTIAKRRSRAALIGYALVAAIVIGAGFGYCRALIQYQYL